MITQTAKDLYFTLNQFLVLPNTWLRRAQYGFARHLKLHLGCGDHYIDGMINVDGNINRQKELWLDLRNRLPFADQSADLIYCSHTLEHLFPYDALKLLSEMHRVVAAEGVVRLAVPSFELCLAIAAGGDESKWPREFEASRAQAINYLFCDGQHKYGYCFENLEIFARQAGFQGIERITEDPDFRTYCGIKLGGEPKGSLILELRR